MPARTSEPPNKLSPPLLIFLLLNPFLRTYRPGMRVLLGKAVQHKHERKRNAVKIITGEDGWTIMGPLIFSHFRRFFFLSFSLALSRSFPLSFFFLLSLPSSQSPRAADAATLRFTSSTDAADPTSWWDHSQTAPKGHHPGVRHVYVRVLSSLNQSIPEKGPVTCAFDDVWLIPLSRSVGCVWT